ncbi:hypothetical protein D910_08385 [Dendroctonus ponderosae]|uniref:PiggyBac transposable element-derived protein domain-containing protein n=1 Tax=Dendroctonus ponderosae TaxID=77166 RepID=U4UFC7_DENPD|nr:hypothetical protein D910_08385 [Dendroctonus ponderosae]
MYIKSKGVRDGVSTCRTSKVARSATVPCNLPSRKTLVKVLQHIPFHTGINNHILQHLKVRVSKLPLLDRHCVLTFDEIALQLGLQYNYKLDCGFVDLRGADRRPKFADYALVFLLKGIRKKWKQPICFTFCEGSTQTADLINLIKSVVRKVRETGLSIVATVSDQGATNAAAIRSLIQDTQRQCIRKGVDNRYQGYLVDEVIVHLYDAPHLFKGIRNGLLKADLHFVEDGVLRPFGTNDTDVENNTDEIAVVVEEDSEDDLPLSSFVPAKKVPDRSVTWAVNNMHLIGLPSDFQSQCGLAGEIFEINPHSCTPYKLFNILISDKILEDITFQTNIYAEQVHQATNKRYTQTKLAEIKTFIGLNLLMGIKRSPSYRDYWSTDEDLNDPYISKLMPNWKKTQKYYNPHNCIAIDESMIKFKGRSALKQYMPKKPIKQGYKIWALADSEGTKANPMRSDWACNIYKVALCLGKSKDCFQKYHGNNN